jgi:acetyl-CoA carboxylase biotin carboxyl carrier protein
VSESQRRRAVGERIDGQRDLAGPEPPASAAPVPERPSPAELLDAVRTAVVELLADLPRRPNRVHLQVGDAHVALEWPEATPSPAGTVPAAAAVPEGDATGTADGGSGDGEDARGVQVCAPVVGVFYQAPRPGDPPFVAVGDDVTAGQQVGIVEAMKVMVPVEAPAAGRVVEILVPDGTSVEFGQPLLVLQPAEGA